MNAAFSYQTILPSVKKCNCISISGNNTKNSSARAAIAIPKTRKKHISQTELISVHGTASTDLFVHEIVERQTRKAETTAFDLCQNPSFHPVFLEEAYERCRDPFKDMIEGMRMDTRKDRYANFEELYMYCYCVAGTVGLMSVPVMGIAPESLLSDHRIYNAALCLGIGNQLTNILRDVGEEGRIYLPQDELAEFGLSDKDVFSRKVTDGWREFMKEQITRARFYFDQAEEGATQLHEASRWPVWSALMLYRMILDSIESNGYDNLTKRAYVGRAKKLLTLPVAFENEHGFSRKQQHKAQLVKAEHMDQMTIR
ncbi:hypothetical protein SASPL_119331 [Salvia splendens]|uniref:15-cis-phytoene synthase n=1 Tax=Salvia splendens TaxID=180675 RepID=A0A8X8XML3_SALSN|nr:hypothetical protein SASPL_119331 [Salvia splendens]